MSRSPKGTNRVRVQLDFVIEYDRDLTSLPIGSRELDKFVDAKALRRKGTPKALAVLGKARGKFSLDYRRSHG